ncbi:MAG: AMP-binding protein [Candidatus Omnitrophica bacterium]|nr:AMP-binding protein [Candidatus Omnitrophota bacterium]
MAVYSLTGNFIRSSERFKDRIALRTKTPEGWSSVTYAELSEKIKALAFYLSSAGVKKTDRAAIMLENSPEWPVIFFALSYIGAIAVPIDPQFNNKDIDNIISDSGAKFILIPREVQGLLKGLEKRLVIIFIEDIRALRQASGFQNAGVEPDDVMLILYTSGTTDAPKGVMLTHKNLCSNFYAMERHKLFSCRDTVLSVLPLYHSYSLMTTMIMPLLSGSTVAYVPHDWPEKLADYIKESETSIFIGVPKIYQMMHMNMKKKLKALPVSARVFVAFAASLGLGRILLPRLRDAFGKDLRLLISGGAKLDKTITRDFLRFGLKMLEGYGLTETSPVVSFNPLKRPRPGSVGKPIADVKVKIINKDRRGIGEIAIKGPNVMKGYYKNEAKTKEVIKDGWFLSGDLGYVDRDGYIYITGRSKEMIVLSSGKNIFPEEIEKHFSATPYVKEMCVLGVRKDTGGVMLEYLHAVIVPDLEFFKERGEMNVSKVIKGVFEVLSKDLPSYRHIMGVTVVHEPLPRTTLGKMKRYEVEKRFMPGILKDEREEKEELPQEKALSESENAKRLAACIKDALDIEGPVRLGDSIELDLGVDSLARVELILAIEKCFDIEFSEEMVAGEIFTVKDLFLKVEGLLGKESGEKLPPGEKALLWQDIVKQDLAEGFKKKILLKPDWADYILTFAVKSALNIFFRVFYSLSVEGVDRIPDKGPYVLCVNHTSFLDGFIVTAGVPFRTELVLFFIAFRRYFIVPIVTNLVKRARIIPIDATEIIEAMQSSAFVLRNGKALCIFPEGERSLDGKPKEFKKGIGIIAKELNVPLVPVFIKGAFEAWPRIKRLPRLHPLKIRFGAPVYLDRLIKDGIRLGARDEYEAISMAIREEIVKLDV